MNLLVFKNANLAVLAPYPIDVSIRPMVIPLAALACQLNIG